jgi:hypothetical protein
MKIRYDDLRQTMEYLEREEVKNLSITVGKPVSDRILFEFEDLKGRQCSIELYSEELLKYPSLTKKMELWTRLEHENAKLNDTNKSDSGDD